MNGPQRPLLAGVDVGGTKVAALVVDADGHPLARAVRSMIDAGQPLGVEPVIAAIEAAVSAAGATARDLAAIGVGVPGGVDHESGVVRHATNLEWIDMPLARLLEDAFGATCRVENDVRLAAAGLIGHEVAAPARSLAYVAVGTGIGAGLVLDGRLYRGERGVAGEIGHVIVDPSGPACRCGQRGCLEAIASGPAIARQAEDAIANGVATSLDADRPLTAKAVYDAAREQDSLALAITSAAGAVIARAIANLAITCDLQRVLVGGGVAAAGPAFLDPIEAELGRLRGMSSLVAEVLPVGTVRLLPPKFDAVAWGGVDLARRASSGRRPEPGRTDESVEEVVVRDVVM
jgi:glucokinase